MIDLYYWPTPNNYKISMFLEETGLPYRIVQVNLQKDEQFNAEFLTIGPNNKVPAIVDHDPVGGGDPLSIFESGAILCYLAEKTGKLMPQDTRGWVDVMQWLFWQVGGLGPMGGQQVFFTRSKEKIPLAIERYTKEMTRLYGVLEKRLGDRAFLVGENYSIADIAAYTWAAHYDIMLQDIDNYPNVERWLDTIAVRPATNRAYLIAKDINPNAPRRPGTRLVVTDAPEVVPAP